MIQQCLRLIRPEAHNLDNPDNYLLVITPSINP